jgi:hypothetical protein
VNTKCKEFLREVTIYFRDFLETDFHKRRLPKRSIRQRNQDNLLVGVKVDKYPSFVDVVWKLTKNNFNNGVLKQISKGSYRASVPPSLVTLVEAQIKGIKEDLLASIASTLADNAQKMGKAYKDDYDRAVDSLIAIAATAINSQIVKPLVNSLAKPLAKLALTDENLDYMMEEELTAILVQPLEDTVATIIREIISGDESAAEAEERFGSLLQIGNVKAAILEFFENFKASDLYLELFEMVRNKSMAEGQEIYLYFGEIGFGNAKYPIFYIPVDLSRDGESLTVEFDPHVFINKKAIDFIAQEFCNQTGKKGSITSATERIIYLANEGEAFPRLVQGVFSELVSFFETDINIDSSSTSKQISKSKTVQISNAASFALFEKSDEAVVNDYEEILLQLAMEDSELGGAFEKIIEDFIEKEPIAFMNEVHDEWDDTTTDEKLVSASPIPLNEEQRQILMAVKREGCNYITVQGPPGTGKSHTITAIVCDAVLNNKSVLVLSDKKEALDVVEDKITETLNRVRHDKDFQNPILRLGKTGSTYGQILSSASIQSIDYAYRAMKNKHDELEKEIAESLKSLKEEIEAEILSGSDINLAEVRELLDYEVKHSLNPLPVDVDELSLQVTGASDLVEFRRISTEISTAFGHDGGHTKNSFPRLMTVMGLQPSVNVQEIIAFGLQCDSIFKAMGILSDQFSDLRPIVAIGLLSDSKVNSLRTLCTDIKSLQQEFLWGWKWWKKSEINSRLKKICPDTSLLKACDSIQMISAAVAIINSVVMLKASIPPGDKEIDFTAVVQRIVGDSGFKTELTLYAKHAADLRFIEERLKVYPKTYEKFGMTVTSISTLCKGALVAMPQPEFEGLIRYIGLKQHLEQKFHALGNIGYASRKRKIEELTTMEMTFRLDGRLINFYNNNQSTAKSLSAIIRKKRRFPKDEFAKLKEAFPCILAGIRDYAEYIPLQSEIFDLVIIDEASQVSIAQAFPALLRARKVLVLGDKKQFSNVKAAHARSETNNEYVNRLQETFKSCVSKEEGKLARIENFNIRTSILEFFEYINNFNIQLNKYFRGYREIISFSNKEFYGNTLQVMKIRGSVIDEVLAFTFLDHDGKLETTANTNKPEINFITSELARLKSEGFTGSVGIITPHTNQQKLLMEIVNKIQDRDWFYDKLHLKIMTFDTCQGEERDIIYYSMVANPSSDKLWGIFVKDLEAVDVEEDGKIKAQRLNVGFSRAKERMHFVLSKPLEQFTGSIGGALRHYSEEQRIAQMEPTVDKVDPKSPMEKKVLGWILDTKLWLENRGSGLIDLVPQFNIGSYLNQLDPTHAYKHPAYKVDFLMTYRDVGGKNHRIVIEYDGFQEHFVNHGAVGKHNYESYYCEEDVFRQKTIESYGYKFLRINRFNSGKNPVETLDRRLRAIIEERPDSNGVLGTVLQTFDGLQTKEVKECPKCKKLKQIAEFKDPELISGVGRICRVCKGLSR